MRFGVAGATMAAGLLVPSLALAQAQSRPAQTPQAQQQSLQVPSAEALLILIRTTLLAFDQANKTNIYHVLHGLGSDRFRAANSPERLAQVFAPFRANNIDLTPVAIMAPQLSRAPAIEQGRLHLVGFIPTQPLRVNFDMWFEPSQGRWKMAQMDVGLVQAPAQAQQQSPQQPSQPQSRQPQGR
jgi:hypothetical protein